MGLSLVLGLVMLFDVVGLGALRFPIGLGMGFGVGLVQARIIAAPGEPRGRWIRASAAGLMLPFLAIDIGDALGVAALFSLPVAVAIGGLLAGLAQSRLLRPRSGRARWWIVASAAGWSLAAATVVVGDRVLPEVAGPMGALIDVTVALAGGLLLGGIGGMALRAILRDPADG